MHPKDPMSVFPTTRSFYPAGYMAHNIQEGMGDRVHLNHPHLPELIEPLLQFQDRRQLFLA